MGTEVEQGKVSVHIYDADGRLCEQPDSWQKGHFAAAHLIPKTTGSYFVIVAVESSPEERTPGRWFTVSIGTAAAWNRSGETTFCPF
jgi:hypothetical protein